VNGAGVPDCERHWPSERPWAQTLATFGQEPESASTMSGRLYDTLLGAAVALVVLGFLDLLRKFKTPGIS
jgi:hypothetical protein